ncbi:MAG: ATP-binding cassette domain-containing protein [Nitriliruptorales bacterium]|nr:ATP-binding cassette domain-containing protein [Nitriliruptorales bacterium]
MADIRLEAVTKRFGGHTAVDDLTLSVDDGEFVTLLGPSGCGKTTTLRMIAGFETPDAGTISVDGEVLSSPGSAVEPQDRGMGMVFQNYALWPHKNVQSNVAYGLKMQKVPRGDRRERVGEILESVGLGGLGRRSPNELSGGQQQRVALARSLVTSPKILLLDEPLSNLDAKLRDRMRSELRGIQRRTGVTFVYVTHDQAEALSMSDRIAVLSGGRLEQFDTPWRVYHRPRTLAVADFMGSVNFLEGQVASVSGSGVAVDVPGLGEIAATGRDAVPGVQVGEPVVLAVRPEGIALHKGHAAGGQGRWQRQGTISSVSLLGNISVLTVSVDSVELKVQTSGYEPYERGESVCLSIDPEQPTVYVRNADTDGSGVRRVSTQAKPEGAG